MEHHASAEEQNGKGKLGIGRLGVMILLGRLFPVAGALLVPSASLALPLGGQAVAGDATVASSSSTSLAITQASQRAIIDWQSFGIAPGESVAFRQPNASAVTLNRVLGSNPSEIQGRISANGQVFLVNPNGVLFGPSASVDVGGLVATTLAISNQDFLAGRTRFTGSDLAGSLRNSGRLTANAYVALIAPDVTNDGTIVARDVVLAAGKQVSLDFAGDDLLKINVDGAALNASIDNSGALMADGGRVLLTARAAGDLVGTVINQSGIIEAKSLSNRNGQIMLDGGTSGSVDVAGTLDVSSKASGSGIDVFGRSIALQGASLDASGQSAGGTVRVGGNSHGTPAVAAGNPDSNATNVNIDAASTIRADARSKGDGGKVVVWAEGNTRFDGRISARGGPQGGNGGFVETSGAQLKVGDNARVDTRAPLGSAGNWLLDPTDFTIAASGGDMTGAALTGNLASGDVSLSSSNNLNVNDAVSWSANDLSLTATSDININAVMTATGSASLDLNPGAGHALLVGFNPGIAAGFMGRVDFSGTGALQINGTPYTVISDLPGLQAMSGSNLYALGSNIAGGAFIPVGTTSPWAPFPGSLNGLGHTISGLAIDLPATDGVGLFGAFNGKLSNVGLEGGTILGHNFVGSLVGQCNWCVIRNAYSSASVTGSGIYSGGLVGLASGNYTTTTGFIANAYATGDVVGAFAVGGLLGYASGGVTLTADYATGNITGSGDAAGGLVGYSYADIASSYARGSVTASGNDVGGLVGDNESTIHDSYAVGAVSGVSSVGGLVGYNRWKINQTYATGQVTGTGTSIGGLVGNNLDFGAASSSYWDIGSSGQATSAAGTGVGAVGITPTAAMTAQATFSGFDFSTTWRIYEGNTLPMLKALLVPLSVTANADGKTYDGLAYSGGNGAAYSDPVAVLSGVLGYGGSAQGARNAGSYAITPQGLWSTQYDITFHDGMLSISKAGLMITAQTNSKTYDGTNMAAALPVTTGLVGGDTVTGSAETYDTADAGSNKRLRVSAYSLNDGNGGNNYTVTQVADATGVVDKAPLTLAPTVANKTYDGSTAATVTGYGLAGFVGTETVTGASTAATFSDKNAASGKTVAITGIGLHDGSNGGLASNYRVAGSATATADITPASLTASVTAADKVYDATTTATITSRTLGGVIGGDAVNLTGGTASFDNKNVGTAKIVTATGLTLAGLDAGNYTANSTAMTTADITPASLSLGLKAGITAADKVYDGTTVATITGRFLAGVIGDDDVILTGGTASFDNKNVGRAKTVTAIGLALSGTAAGNYTANTTATTTADIGPKPLMLVVTAADKTYDGSTATTVTGYGLTGFVGTETVTGASTAATFSDKNAASGKTVAVTGISLNDGANGGLAANYRVAGSATTTAAITPASLTASVTAADKVYDGTTAATITSRTLGGVIRGDTVSLTGGAASFDNKNVGTAKLVTANGLALSGPDAGNYRANATAATMADIAPAQLIYLADSASRAYGQVNPALTGEVIGFLRGETQADATTGSLTFGSPAVPTSPVGSYEITGGGLSAANYSFSQAPENSTALQVFAAAEPPVLSPVVPVAIPPLLLSQEEAPILTSQAGRSRDDFVPCRSALSQNSFGSYSLAWNCGAPKQ